MDFSQHLPYLANRLRQKFVEIFSPVLEDEDIDIQTWRVLSVLEGEGVLTLTEVAELSSINLSTLSRLVRRMQKKGLVERRRAKEDRRAVALQISDEGSRLVSTLLPAARRLEADAEKCLAPHEVQELKRLLKKLHKGLTEEEQGSSAIAGGETLVIPPEFCGPTDSGHGGYTAGQLAREIDGPAEVTLRQRIPLDKPLLLQRDEETVRLMENDEIIAEAVPAEVDIDPIDAPTLEEAVKAEKMFIPVEDHLYPHCFVCGPERDEGDGLRVFSGILPGARFACAPWVPGVRLARDDGRIDDPYIWALLDCPAYFAMNLGDTYVLTGTMAADIIERPWSGETYVVAGWKRGEEGRKHYAGSAIYDLRGNVMAKAASTWIEPRSAD